MVVTVCSFVDEWNILKEHAASMFSVAETDSSNILYLLGGKILFGYIGGLYVRCAVTTMEGRRVIAQSGPIGEVKTGNVETRIESDPYLCVVI
jgi:hypothetical protein